MLSHLTVLRYLSPHSEETQKDNGLGTVGTPKMDGFANGNMACRKTLVITGTVQALPVNRSVATFDKNVPNSGLKP